MDLYYWYVGFTWAWIRKQFTPRMKWWDDPLIDRMAFWRSMLGLATVAVGALQWSHTAWDIEDTATWMVVGPYLQAPIALSATIVAIPTVAIAAPGESLRSIARRTARPFVLAGAVTIAVAAFVALIQALSVVVFVVVLAALAPVVGATVWYGNRYLFGAMDAHPLVPYVVGILVALFGLSPLAPGAGPAIPGAASPVRLAIVLTGPVLVTVINALAAYRWWSASRRRNDLIGG